MNRLKEKDNRQRYLLVGVGIFGIAIIIRFVLIRDNCDIGTANLIFCAVFIFGMVVYWALSPILTEIFTPLFNKIFSLKNAHVPQSSEGPYKKEVDIAIDLSVQQFCKYSDLAFTKHLTKDDLNLLYDYILLYSKGLRLINIEQIEVTNLCNGDLYHYGWNMWYHFGKNPKQDYAVKWLKAVFVNLRDIEVSTIKGKLTIDEKDHYEIPLCKNIAEMLNQQHL